MRRALCLLPLVLLVGCAGYASDYLKSKGGLIAPQLERFGMTGATRQCVENKLTESLSVWQLRQLTDYAARVAPGASLGAREFLYVAGLVEDPKVGPEVRTAIEGCNVAIAAVPGTTTAGSAPAAQPEAATVSGEKPAAAAQIPEGPMPLWVNLGAAATGQGIAVDATSVTRGPSWRQAWFRLLNTDQSGVGDIGYLLRIDCATKVITAHAGRKYAPGGALVEQRQYEKPEGPMGIEPGTVIEVAYHALCDDPK